MGSIDPAGRTAAEFVLVAPALSLRHETIVRQAEIAADETQINGMPQASMNEDGKAPACE